MAEIIWFLRQGWKITWKQKLVWLFSAFSLAISLFRLFQIKSESNSGLVLLYLAGTFLSIVLGALNYIGMRYLVYCFTMNSPATFGDAFSAVGKFFGRVLGCSLLGALILSPFFFLILVLPRSISTQSIQQANIVILMFIPLSIFSAIVDFTIFEFFEKEAGIRQTLSKSWGLFTSHFGILASIGIILLVVYRMFSAASGILTVLIQSGFDMAALSKLNYLDPSVSFGRDLPFAVVDGVIQMIYTVFSTSVFALAYLKYHAAKKPLLIKRVK